MKEIVEAVARVSDLIAQIAASSVEQSTGIDEINRAIAAMDEMTQQNASLVEETSAASQSLKDEGKELLNLMNFFVTENNVTTFERKTRQPTSPPKAKPAVSMHKAPVHQAVHKMPPRAAEEGDEWEEF